MLILRIFFLILLFVVGCSSASSDKSFEEIEPDVIKVGKEQEPVLKGDIGLHDPSGIVEDQEYLITLATGRSIRYSYIPPGSDEWISGERIFPRDQRPAWMDELLPENKGFWAPHTPFPRVMYYSSADDTDGKDMAGIGRAIAVGDPPDYTWVDDGKPVLFCDRDDIDEPFAIDPAVFKGDNGTLWMVYGSHWSGIWIVELNPETGHIKDSRARKEGWKRDNPAFHYVASEVGRYHKIPEGEEREANFISGNIEAPYVFWNENNNYYYLFVNWGVCCSGVNSTYEIRIGRSRKPTGPYHDKEGHDMSEGGGTLFLEREGRFIGPGHANIFTYKDSKGVQRHVFSYHFYDGQEDGRAKMNARYLVWDAEDWPVQTNKLFYKKK
ncbi:MAG: arabinan endo-1,5-alpha-L-arabinosidase [Planctomycetota bacterium]|jgi:arabinan endo-1,5-alpha-L-arabinosidase